MIYIDMVYTYNEVCVLQLSNCCPRGLDIKIKGSAEGPQTFKVVLRGCFAAKNVNWIHSTNIRCLLKTPCAL